MDAKIMIGSGKSGRGKAMGCVGGQCYAIVLDISTRDESGCYTELHVTGPCDNPRRAAMEWANANGVKITGNFQPQAITGADADIRANSPRV